MGMHACPGTHLATPLSLSDSDGPCYVDDSTTKCDRLSDTYGDKVDGYDNTGDNRHANRELPVSDTIKSQQLALPGNTSNDTLQDNNNVYH